MNQPQQKSDTFHEPQTGIRRIESTTSGMLDAKFGILLAELSSTNDPARRLVLLEKLRQIQQKMEKGRSQYKAPA